MSADVNKHEVFEAWAPPESIWSDWAKPVLFAHLTQVVVAVAEFEAKAASGEPQAPLLTDVSWCPAATDGVAIVADLSSPRGVDIGLTLAARGYRPVPLYNACPPSDAGQPAVVDVIPIMRALVRGAEALRSASLPPDAPPVFLLDADRRFGVRAPGPEMFDNRSVSLPTDFPSAAVLLSRGVRRAILLQERDDRWPQEDLAHTLLRWQQDGIDILAKRLDAPDPPTPIVVAPPLRFGSVFQRFLAVLGLRRNPLGGFGGTLPEASAG